VSSSSSSSVSSSSSSSGISQDYTRGDEVALPGNDTDLENVFTAGDYDDVSTDNGVRVCQSASEQYSIFLFKDKWTQEDIIEVQWNGQSDLAPSSSTVFLQIYNRNSTTWETLDSDSISVASTDFTLAGSQTTNLSNYFDASFWISCRVYQNA